MVRPTTFAIPIALFLTACGEPQIKTIYAAPPEVLALFAGQSRGADLSLARACGADAKRVGALATSEQAPTSLPAEASSIYKASLVARAESTTEGPSLQLCDTVRKRSDIAALFPPPPLQTRAERAALAERKARAAPAYCAEGTQAVVADPTVTAGLKALREKCNPGDTIALPVNATGIIASACDLSKPIPVADPNVFCTLGRIREMRLFR